jgi:hypothetical protein
LGVIPTREGRSLILHFNDATSGSDAMKRGVAIIKPFILEEVRGVLREVGVPGMTITEVMGFCHQRGRTSVLVE